ncbi:spore cortex biosynthesis protein YabQ [Bacillus sp. FJAT-45350]|uniref:spore cortex biosynthesis protein YabQ n=1 Tax=Bacillus sp. FJAT-45350 TaxID=2011014 RepID=UPI000BB7BBC4|nr:spore cortex biosynthesis protein YabQ [Bacillus sp. FJAT-45350]
MTLTVQLNTMLSMVAMGIWVGAAIDTYGRFAKERRSFHWMTALNDLLFWIVQGLLVFYVLLNVNQGEMRFYILLALICGFAAYRALFQRHYQMLLERVIAGIISLYRFMRSVFIVMLYNPLKSLLKLLYTLCMMLVTLLLTILVTLFKIFYKPLRWIGIFLYKLCRIYKVVGAIRKNKYVQKGKKIIDYLFRRSNRGDE